MGSIYITVSTPEQNGIPPVPVMMEGYGGFGVCSLEYQEELKSPRETEFNFLEMSLSGISGHKVKSFRSPDELWAAYSETLPELAIVDVGTGDPSGYIRESSERHVPIIVITENGKPGCAEILDGVFFLEKGSLTCDGIYSIMERMGIKQVDEDRPEYL